MLAIVCLLFIMSIIVTERVVFVKRPVAPGVHFQSRGTAGGIEEGAADIGVPATALVLGAQSG
jgi:hypothetical protein